MHRTGGPQEKRARREGGAAGFLRRGAGVALRLRYLLFQQHRHRRVVLEETAGKKFVVLPEVFNPVLFRSGELLARALDDSLLPPGATVLDMGTGTGIASVFAARTARRVVAVDINPEAVRCARINVLLHHLEQKVEVREGDLFAPVVGERFDLVLFNPPYFRGRPRDTLDRAWRGEDVVERFATALPAHLAPGGEALVILSTDGDTPAFLAAFRRAGLSVTIARQHERLNELLTIYRLRATP